MSLPLRHAGVVAIDVGSSSVRAGVFDADGREAAPVVQVAYDLDTDRDGRASVAMEVLRDLVVETLDRLMPSLPPGLELRGVGVDTFWHGLVGADAGLAPTTEVLLWADSRARAEARKLREHPMTRDLHAGTGCPPHSSFWVAKLRWLAKARPDDAKRTAWWLSPGDLLLAWFFGRLGTSISLASGTGLMSLRDLGWHGPALGLAGVGADRLPQITEAPYLGLLPFWARRWPALASIPWFPVRGDGACSSLGSGATDDSRAVCMIGTSGSLRVLRRASSATVSHPAFWCYRLDRHTIAEGYALSEGGNVAAWARSVLQLPSDVDDAVMRLAADAHGLAVLPFLAGTRSPDWDEGRTAAIEGLTMATTPVDIYRALLEAVALRFAEAMALLEEVRPGPRQIIAAGGGLVRSRAWPQLLADALGRPVHVSAVLEASLRGAALAALGELGLGGISEDPVVSRVVAPDMSAHAVYQAARVRQRRFFDLARPR